MEMYWYIMGGLLVFSVLLGINNKIAHKRKMKKMDDEIKKRMRYYRHPLTSFSEDEAKRLK